MVERVETTAETQRCRRQLFEHDPTTSVTLLLAASSQMLLTTDVRAAITATCASIIMLQFKDSNHSNEEHELNELN